MIKFLNIEVINIFILNCKLKLSRNTKYNTKNVTIYIILLQIIYYKLYYKTIFSYLNFIFMKKFPSRIHLN